MKKLFIRSLHPFPSSATFNWAIFLFRFFISSEMIVAHGFKKIGIGVTEAEHVPNPLHLPAAFNSAFAVSANIFFPSLVLIGFCTRLATLPTLAVTLTGYFVVHWNDSLLEKDAPFIYSVIFLLILALGPGKYSIDNYIYEKTIK